MNRSTLWAPGILGAAAAAYLGPAIAAGQFWAVADGLTQNMPHAVTTASALRAGELPFWNAYAFCGMPFFATSQTGVLFPGNAAYLLLDPVWAQNATVWLAMAGAGAGLYAFARALALPRPAALLAGLVFMLGGFVTMRVEHVQMAQAAALAPVLLWAVERFAQEGRRRHAAAAAAVVAGMVFAGHPQLMAYSCLLATAYALFRAIGLPAARRRGFLAAGVGAAAAGLGLSAVQLLPTLDMIGGTQRAAWGPYTFAFEPLTPQGFVGFFAPYLYGVRGPAGLVDQPEWGVPIWSNFREGYVGMAALLLALVALGRFRAERQVRFWAGVAVVGVLLALGPHTPLAEVVARVPVLNQMRYAHRHLFEVTLALALLAGHGLAWLLAIAPPDAAARKRALLAAGGALVGAGGVLVAAIAVVGGDLATRLQPYMPPDVHMAAALSPAAAGVWLPLATAAAAAWAAARVLARGRAALVPFFTLVLADLLAFGHLQGMEYRLSLAPSDRLGAPIPDREAGREVTVPRIRYPRCVDCDDLAYLRRLRYPDVSTYAGLATVNGYDAFLPSRLGRLAGMDSFGHAGELDPALWEPRNRLLDLLGCRTVRLEAAVSREPAWRARMASGRWERLPDEDGLTVLRNPRALPLAWRVTRATSLPAEGVDRRLAGLDGPFDPRAEVLLDAPDAATFDYEPAPVESRWDGRNRIVVKTASWGPGLVVVSEGYDPGWTARLVKGPTAPRDLPVMRADGVIMAFVVPTEPSTVVMTYRPRRLDLGLAVTAASAAGLAAWLAAWGFLRRRRAGAAGPIAP